MVDQSGKVIGITSYVHDITHQKQQEDALRRTQKMDALGHLTGGISHDFNNMLGVILGYAELLKMELSEQPTLSNYVDEILHASERGAKLTRKLLSFSKQKSVEPMQLNINSLLQNNKDMLEKTLTARVKLEFELANNLWPISVDVNDLEDMILNMSINAKHAMAKDGNIYFKTQNEHLSAADAERFGISEGDYVRFTIADTGKGMDKITCDHIFEPFFSTKGSDGTGLGLSQVYGFITRSHGAIKVYSEIDHGTQFDVYFPRSTESGADDSVETKIPSNDSLRGTETLLVVDDEKPLRELMSVIFQEQGYTVLLVKTANMP